LKVCSLSQAATGSEAATVAPERLAACGILALPFIVILDNQGLTLCWYPS
jgi:hypothetical protein